MSIVQTSTLLPTDDADQSLSVELITGQELPQELIERATALDLDGPFVHATWWSCWWRQLRPPGSELFLLCVWQGSQLVGLAPWYTQRALGFGRVVRCLGDGRACSDYVTLAAAPEHREKVWDAITQWVAAEAGRSWDYFVLSGMSGADDRLQRFCEQISQHDIASEQHVIASTWRVSLPTTWDEYVELFSKQHRNRLRRTKREMLDSGRVRLHRVTSPDDFERGFGIQRRLHQIRRNSLGDGGCFADSRFEMFLSEANRCFLEQGKLRLQWSEVDGEPVAFDSGYVSKDGLFIYQTAFDPAKSDLSPGRLHLQASILKAIDEGYRFFDFLRGDEPYKAHFRATAIPVLELRLIAPKLSSRLGHRLWQVQKKVKRELRARVLARGTGSKTGGDSLEVSNPVSPVNHTSVGVGSKIEQWLSAAKSGPRTRLGALAEDCRRFGATTAAKGIAYRVARRASGLKLIHLLSLELADLSQLSIASGFQCRWLAADDICMHATDPANDLDASMAERLANGRNFCFASFDGAQLVNYSWYALDSIEPEHSFDVGISYPTNTAYLYKAYTHPAYRGRHVHHSTVSQAFQLLAEHGISRMIALVECGNTASLRSHGKLGFRNLGRMLIGGRQPLRVQSYPRLPDFLGIHFGNQAIELP